MQWKQELTFSEKNVPNKDPPTTASCKTEIKMNVKY